MGEMVLLLNYFEVLSTIKQKCVCVCVRERGRERKRETDRPTDRHDCTNLCENVCVNEHTFSWRPEVVVGYFPVPHST